MTIRAAQATLPLRCMCMASASHSVSISPLRPHAGDFLAGAGKGWFEVEERAEGTR